MARRKVKTVYLTPEPKWDQYKDITDGPAQEKAFQDLKDIWIEIQGLQFKILLLIFDLLVHNKKVWVIQHKNQ